MPVRPPPMPKLCCKAPSAFAGPCRAVSLHAFPSIARQWRQLLLMRPERASRFPARERIVPLPRFWLPLSIRPAQEAYPIPWQYGYASIRLENLCVLDCRRRGCRRALRVLVPGGDKDLQPGHHQVPIIASRPCFSHRLGHPVPPYGGKRCGHLSRPCFQGPVPKPGGLWRSSGLQFFLEHFGLAFFWLLALWGLILWMIFSFREVRPPWAWLQFPYILWISFAGYLNLGVWRLNG